MDSYAVDTSSEEVSELSIVLNTPLGVLLAASTTCFALPTSVNITGLPAVIAPSATRLTVPPPAWSTQAKALEPSVLRTWSALPSALGNTHTSLEAMASGALKPT